MYMDFELTNEVLRAHEPLLEHIRIISRIQMLSDQLQMIFNWNRLWTTLCYDKSHIDENNKKNKLNIDGLVLRNGPI